MQEVLTKTIDLSIPLRDQEFFELGLLDEANDLGTRHYVRQVHFAWNETDGDVMPDSEEVEYFWILGEAIARYAQRRDALEMKGYKCSDMDLI